MSETDASMAVGAAAIFLAITLLALRLEFRGRRPVVALIGRWGETGAGVSAIVIALLSTIAVVCFERVAADQVGNARSASALNQISHAPGASRAAPGSEINASDAQALDALRDYADGVDTQPQPIGAGQSPRAELPDVDTMIAHLASRLEKNPSDVKGWKMLGWSYLNMGKPAESERAYERAFKLDSADAEIAQGLAAAKSAQTANPQAPAVASPPK